mgnify:CR=1 FL=1
METQGVIGIEDELDPKDIAEADVVILAVDVNVKGKERFAGKRWLKYQQKQLLCLQIN